MDNLTKGIEVSGTLDSLLAKKDFNTILSAVEAVASNEQNIINAKKLFDSLLTKLGGISNDDLIEFGQKVLKAIGQKSHFEYHIAKIKENMADVYSAQSDFYSAARILSEVNFESQNLKYTDMEKLENYIKIAEFYFEYDDSTSAESYVRKCSQLVEKTDNREMHLRFEVCFARSLDHARKFLQSASKYHWLSLQTGIDESNLFYLLDCSIVCAILGAAGPQRSRILASLYKDERSRRSEHFDIFYNMYVDRIITKKEKEKFADSLKKHQKAKLYDDFTVLDKAVIEHNIVAISKLYETISFDTLSKMLYISKYPCEKIIHSMINEKRLNATIDQVSGYIDFTQEFDEYNTWTEGINHFCTSLDKLVSKVTSQ